MALSGRLRSVAARGLPSARRGAFRLLSSPPTGGVLRSSAATNLSQARARAAAQASRAISAPVLRAEALVETLHEASHEAEDRLHEAEALNLAARFPPTENQADDARGDAAPIDAAPYAAPAAAQPHQRAAIAAAVRCLSEEQRARVVLPPGAGKILVGLGVLEALTPFKGVALVVLPRKALIEQMLRVYREHSTLLLREDSSRPFKNESVLIVAGDMAETNVNRTTDPAAIAAWLKEETVGPKLLLSTYFSLDKIADALQLNGTDARIDAAVFDEANKMVGRRSKQYTLGLDDTALLIGKRCFLTSTPTVFPHQPGEEVREMESGAFGVEAFRMTHLEAVSTKVAVPVKLVLTNVAATYTTHHDKFPDLRILQKYDALPAGDVELALTALDACERFGLKKAISLHNSNEISAQFQSCFNKLFQSEGAPWDFTLQANPPLFPGDEDVADLIIVHTAKRSHLDVIELASRPAAGKANGYVLLPVQRAEAEKVAGQDFAGEKVEGKNEGVGGAWDGTGNNLHLALDKQNAQFAVNVLRTLLEQDSVLQDRLAEAQKAEGRQVDVSSIFEDRLEFVGFEDADGLKRSLSNATLVMTDLWEEHFTNLQKYHQEHGDCMVGQNFITGDGHPLGAWVQSQRSKHSDDDGGLSAERAAKLDSLGFVWDSLDAAWNEGFEQLKLYQAGRGDCHVPRSFQTKDGHKLGLWVTVQRQRKRIDGWILESRMRKLEDIGFSWVVSDALWEEGFGHLQKYHADVGHCDVPQRFKVDGYPLGSWVQAQRPKKKGAQGGLKEDQFQRLEGLGFLWETREKGWEEGLQLLKIYNAEKGNVRVPGRYAIEGFNLGSWLHNLRSRKVEGKLSEDRSLALEGLGVTWETSEEAWSSNYQRLKDYKEEFADVLVPQKFELDGHALGRWVQSIRKRGRDGIKLSKALQLEELGFVWDPLDAYWDEGYNHLADYVKASGKTDVLIKYKMANGFPLGQWCSSQRKRHSHAFLSKEKTLRLEALGFKWVSSDEKWGVFIQSLTAYKTVKGDVDVSVSFVTAEGLKLGTWLHRQRSRMESLSAARVSELSDLGVVFDSSNKSFDIGYAHLKAYVAFAGDARVVRNFVTTDGYALGGWVHKIRKGTERPLKEEQKMRLNELGFAWDGFDKFWAQGIAALQEYFDSHNDTRVHRTFETADGFMLGRWVEKQREKKRGARGGLNEKQAQRLDDLGFS